MDWVKKRADAVARQRQLVEAATVENRQFTDEEDAQFEAANKEIATCDRMIKAENTVREHEDNGGNAVRRPQVIPGPAPVDRKDNGGFANLGEFIHAVRFGDPKGRLQNAVTQEMSTGEAGGFQVPEQFRDDLLMVQPEDALVRPRATVIPAGDPPDAKIIIPALDQSDDVYGGVAVTWIAEGVEKPQTNAKLRAIELEPQEVAGHIEVTDKLLRNWTAASSLLSNLMRGAIVSAEDLAFLTGDGVGKPKGILNSAAAIAYNRATANKVQFADVAGMLGKFRMESQANAVWKAHQTVLPQLIQLKDDNGNSIFIRGDVTKGVPDTLLGFPVRWTGKGPSLGSKGDLALLDLAYYLIKDGSGPFVAASEHVLFRENKTIIKAFWNVDGQSWLNSALTLDDGSTTVSPFVILDVVSG